MLFRFKMLKESRGFLLLKQPLFQLAKTLIGFVNHHINRFLFSYLQN
ncbi:hypothetical protein Hanom_Chr07g00635881 [Helianthus anomalus]